jgi:protein TonB
MAALNLFPPIETREYRALQIAVVASLVLHAAVLFLAPGFRARERPPALPTLTAVLRSQPQPQETTPVPAVRPQPEPETKPSPTPQPVAEPRPKPETVKPRAQTPVMTAPSSQPVFAVPPAESAPAEAKSAPTASASPATQPATVASTAPTSAASRGEQADPNALQTYKIQLAAYAQKYQRYPSLARENNWEGIAEVKLTIGENGRIREVIVVSSSGHDILDQQAIEMVRKAAPITEIPSALRNKEFPINLPIVFHLEHKGG